MLFKATVIEMKELQLDDFDLDHLRALSKGLRKNYAVGSVIEVKAGKVTKSLIRLRDIPKKYRKMFHST